MNADRGQLDAIEDALLELGAVEQARVFDRTRVEPGELLKVDPAERLSAFRRGVLRWVPVAAAVGMVAFVGTSMFRPGVGPGGPLGVADTKAVADKDKGCAGEFVDCFTGPNSAALADACTAYDYDGDSDVDMFDWRILDLNCRRLNHANQ